MGGDSKSVSWYDDSYKKEKKQKANQQGKMAPTSPDTERGSDKNIQATDPATVNPQVNVFTKVAKTFTLLFNKDNGRFDRPEAPSGWTTTGELSLLRAEQDAQYEFMEELEMKIEDLKKEVEEQKMLVKAYETKVKQHEEYLQHCMHWISMAQIFGDVPVAKDRMNWKAGRDDALVGPDEVDDDACHAVNGDEAVQHGLDAKDLDTAHVEDVNDAQNGEHIRDTKKLERVHAFKANTAQ